LIYGIRRSVVNTSGSVNYKDTFDPNKKYCPREGRLLTFRTDLNTFFCPECGYIFADNLVSAVKAMEATNEAVEASKPAYTIYSSNRVRTTSTGTISRDEGMEVMKIRPIGNNNTRRSGKNKKEDKSKIYAGWDSDLERLEEVYGYSIVQSTEDVGEKGTFSTSENKKKTS